MIAYDRVRETTDTEGDTDPFALLGVDGANMVAFGTVLSDGERFPYACVGATQFEIGLGRYDAGNNEIIRERVFSNSEQTQDFIDFVAGTKKLWIDHPAFLDRLASSGVFLALSRNVGIF